MLVDRPVESTDLVPTLGSLFGFSPRLLPWQGVAGGAVAHGTAQQMQAEQFRSYPPQAKQIATGNIPLLQQLPLAFLPLLLREVIVYDWKFPAEQDEIDRQFRYLAGLTADQLSSAMSSFAKLKLSPDLEAMDWIGCPIPLLREAIRISLGKSPDRRFQHSRGGLHTSVQYRGA